VLPAVFATEVSRRIYEFVREHRDVREVGPHIDTATIDGDTIVQVDHSVPPKAPRWRITTTRQLLPKAHFGARVCEKLAEAADDRVADQPKGRAIYCVDLERQEVIAALSYHIPRDVTEPLLITAIALRRDDDDPGLWQDTQVGARLAKRYVHALARKLRHPSYVDFSAESTAMSLDLGLAAFHQVPPAGGRRRHRPNVSYRQPDE
jgi:hypothetical protein